MLDLAKTVSAQEAITESTTQLFELAKKISGFPGKLVKPSRRFLMEGSLNVVCIYYLLILIYYYCFNFVLDLIP